MSPGCSSRILWRSLRFARFAAIAVGLAGTAWPQSPAQSSERLTVGYVEVASDPRYDPVRGYGRLVLKRPERPFTGAEVALDEAQPLGRVTRSELALARISVPSPAEIAPAVVQARETRNIHFFLVDAPAESFKGLAEAIRGRDILVFNPTVPDGALRRGLCAAEIVHTLPSLAMYTDALVQHFVSRKWSSFLVLEGPLAHDAAMTKAFEQSAQKFGARIVARRQFKPGADPREREQNDAALLSAVNRDYDVVFVADGAFDFVRQVPYRTLRPRPVAGSIDLEPVAWHWTWERHGAPQLNSRFERRSGGRHMESADWASWITVKMVAQATLRTGGTDFNILRKFILSDGSFDGSKGLAVSVRSWDHQLRQTILLATPHAVAAEAPVEGFLHKIDNLDTLGDDKPESSCRLGE